MDSLFEEYQDKPTKIFKIGDYALVKYEKKEDIDRDDDELSVITKYSPIVQYYKDREYASRMIGKGVKELTEKLQEEVNIMVKKKRGIVNERQSIVKEFVDEINKERKDTKYKPVTGRGIAMKLSIFKTNHELREFHSICLDYKNRHKSFSRRFFGGFKKHDFSTD